MWRVPVLMGPARGHWLPLEGIGVRTALRFALGRYELEVARFLRRTLPTCAVFFDVGAANGYFTRLAMRCLPPSGTVIAFEPNPAAHEKLLRLTAHSHQPKTIVRPEAVAASDGSATLAQGEKNQSASLEGAGVPLPGPAREKIPVPVRSIDSLVGDGEVPAPDAVKIDAEGAELAILRGMSTVLVSKRPTLAVECHSMRLMADVIQALADADYQRLRCTSGGDHIGPPMILATPHS